MNKMKSSTLHCLFRAKHRIEKHLIMSVPRNYLPPWLLVVCCRQLPLLSSSLLLLLVLQFCVKTTEYSVAVATLPSLSPPTLPLFLSTAAAASDASTCSRVSELSFLSLQCLNVSSNSLVLTGALLLCLEYRISISLLLFVSLLFVVNSKRD